MDPRPSSREQEPIQASGLSHEKSFLYEAKQYLGQEKIQPKWGENYYLQPGSTAYQKFLAFIIEELHALPFNNEHGETRLGRADAKEVVKKLIEYLQNQLQLLLANKNWDSNLRTQLTPYFDPDDLEVFKNQIYPRHAQEGVGYNLDLSTTSTDQDAQPLDVRLERRYIYQPFKVMDHGFFKLNLKSGLLEMDLEEFPTGHVHTE